MIVFRRMARKLEVWQKSSLEWYKWETKPKCEAFYNGSRLGSVLFFKARNKSIEVNSGTYRWVIGEARYAVCVLTRR